MKTTKRQSDGKDHFDMLPYISILMCVLGCLLLVTMSVSALTPPSDDTPLITRDTAARVVHAKPQFDALDGEINLAERTLEQERQADALAAACAKMRQALEEKEKERSALQGKIDADQLAATVAKNIQAEIAKLASENQDLLKQIAPLTNSASVSGLFGHGFPTNYILLECLDRVAVVYPGNIRVATNNPADINWLRGRVREVKAAALVARPASFDGTFYKFQELVTELAQFDHDIRLSSLPLKSTESIQPYLPKGQLP